MQSVVMFLLLQLTPIALDRLAPPCVELGKLASSPSQNQALSARIALGRCVVEQEVKKIALCDCEQAVDQINEVLDPTLAMLDEVFGAGDPATQILARHAQGDLLASLATRMLATVPAPTDSSESAAQLHETRLRMLRPMIEPWLARAHSAFEDVDRLARANPQVTKNPAVAAAVQASRRQGVAKR